MDEIKSPAKAIRAKCLDCCCGSQNEVRLCPCSDCPLHPFRFGKNPYRTKREYSDEEKEILRRRLEKARAASSENGRIDAGEISSVTSGG